MNPAVFTTLQGQLTDPRVEDPIPANAMTVTWPEDCTDECDPDCTADHRGEQ